MLPFAVKSLAGNVELGHIINWLFEAVLQAAVDKVTENESCKHSFKLLEVYLNYLRKDNGPLSAFWMSYINLLDVMFGLIRASGEGDWRLHLASIRGLILWCFAYDRLNYERYLPLYYE